MKWCVYLVTLYIFVNGDCKIDTRKTLVLNNSNKQEVILNSVLKSNVTFKYVDTNRPSSLVESEGFNSGFMKGKHCLKNFEKCVKEDDIYQKSALPIIEYLVGKSPPFDMSAIEGISEDCRKSSQKYIEDLHKFRYWALQMYDATAKMPSGFLSGNVLQFGDFDLCMMSNNAADNIYSKYCLANIQFDFPESNYLSAIYNLIHSHGIIRSNLKDSGHRVPRFSSVQWAICVPHSCTVRDVGTGLNKVLTNIFNETTIQYKTLINDELCTSAKPKDLPISTVIVCIFFISIIAFQVFATLYDMLCKNVRKDFILAFSLQTNIGKLCSLNSENDIDAIHTIRFVNGIMLLAAHKSMASLFLPYVNRTVAAESLGEPWTVIGRAASLYTDPFIMISGALTAYSFFGKLKKSNKINLIEEYASRLLRILPPFMALIMFCTFILPWMNAGPLWHSVVTHHSNICKQYWWRNIFFIHNYFGFENMCLTHTHHIGIDTQLFFISPLLTLLVWKWPKGGIFALCLLGGISTWMRYHVTYTQNLANYVYYGVSSEQLFLTADYMYIIPAHRLTVYIMGIILGYLLRQHKIKFKKVYVHIGNFMAVLCFCGAFVAPSFMGRFDYVYNPRDAAWYAAYAPILWCLSFGWFIYITHVGHLSYLKSILQNPIPKFWTKISYAVYLTQFPVYFYNVGITKHIDELGVISKQLNFLEFLWIIILSIKLTLFFETPFQNIKDYIFKKTRPKGIATTVQSTKLKLN